MTVPMEHLRLLLFFIFPSINPEMCVYVQNMFHKKDKLLNQWGKDDLIDSKMVLRESVT